MRIILGLQYDGSKFSGWQRQENLRTVQKCVEEALSKVANTSVIITCSGRTDAGVHAVSQVIHFDAEVERKDSAWILGANSYLPGDISVMWMKKVSNEFHARFSAIRRHYRYVILNTINRPSLFRNYVTWFNQPLNEKAMNEAANYFLGEHDFSSFRAADCQSKSSYRCVEKVLVERQNDFIVIDLIANAFLQHMVRNMVGVLLPIGIGKKPPIWAKEVLASEDRKVAGITAPAAGLYLMAIDYPDEFNLPKINRDNVFPMIL